VVEDRAGQPVDLDDHEAPSDPRRRRSDVQAPEELVGGSLHAQHEVVERHGTGL
jgi:hypothetical protein